MSSSYSSHVSGESWHPFNGPELQLIGILKHRGQGKEQITETIRVLRLFDFLAGNPKLDDKSVLIDIVSAVTEGVTELVMNSTRSLVLMVLDEGYRSRCHAAERVCKEGRASMDLIKERICDYVGDNDEAMEWTYIFCCELDRGR